MLFGDGEDGRKGEQEEGEWDARLEEEGEEDEDGDLDPEWEPLVEGGLLGGSGDELLGELGELREVRRGIGPEEDDGFGRFVCAGIEEGAEWFFFGECLERGGEVATGVEGEDGSIFPNPDLVVCGDGEIAEVVTACGDEVYEFE